MLWIGVSVAVVVGIGIVALIPSGGGRPSPEWASFFKPAEYRRFDKLVRLYFKQKRQPVEIDDGIVYLPSKSSSDRRQFGLLNIAQLCHQSKDDEWPTVIKDHFDRLESLDEHTDAIEEMFRDFKNVREKLVVRLYPDDMEIPEGTVSRSDLPGTITLLAVDLPDAIQTVRQDHADGWEKSNDELFQIALDNIRRMTPPEVQTMDIPAGGPLLSALGDDFYVACRILTIDSLPQMIGKRGAIVAVPHRHMLLSLPADDAEIVKGIPAITSIAQGAFDEGPGSVSPRVYWYESGVFHDMQCELKDGELHASPPDRVIEILNELAEKK